MNERRTPLIEGKILVATGKKNWAAITVKDLQTIQNLDLSYNDIKKLKAHDFWGMTSLRWLNLNNNKLESLPDRIFSGLSSLRELNLSNNKLVSLPAGIFPQNKLNPRITI